MFDLPTAVLAGLLKNSRHVVHSSVLVATQFTHGMTTNTAECLAGREGQDIQRPFSMSPSTTLGLVCVKSHRLLRKRHDIVSMMRSSARDVFIDDELKYSS